MKVVSFIKSYKFVEENFWKDHWLNWWCNKQLFRVSSKYTLHNKINAKVDFKLLSKSKQNVQANK